MGSVRRRIRWLCFGGSGALLGLALIPGRAVATAVDETGRPSSFGAVAAAAAVHQQVDAKGGVSTVVEPVFTTAPDSLTEFGAATARARASTLYPGATIVSAGLLLCGQVIEPNTPIGKPVCPPAASYPMTVELPVPGQASTTHASTPASLNVSMGQGFGGLSATSAAVHSARDYVSSDAVDAAYDLAGPPGLAAAADAFRQQAALLLSGPLGAGAVSPQAGNGTALHVGTAETHASERFPDPAHRALLVVSSTSILKGIDLLGGVVHIDAITTTSTHQTDGVAAPVHHDQVTVTGVSVGGQPATIDQNGITVAGSGQAKPVIDGLNAALQQLMAASGGVVRVISPTPGAPAGGPPSGLYSPEFGTGCRAGEADGVQLYVPADVRTIPYPAGSVYFTNITLGSSCADAAAGADRISDLSVIDSGSGSAAVASGSPAVAPAPSSDFGAASTDFSNPIPAFTSGKTPTSRPPPTRRVRPPALQTTPAFFGAALKNRLGMLYLSFTLAFLGLCLGFRQLAPARLPSYR